MATLSIDVGIKNLAFCLLEGETNQTNPKILKWDSIDLSTTETPYKCGSIVKGKGGGLCGCPAKVFKNNLYFCNKHSKKEEFQAPIKMAFIQKQTLLKLFELADKYHIAYTKPIKKCNLIKLFQEHIDKNCFNEIVVENASHIDLITIGKNLKKKFDEIFAEGEVATVVIENQISPIATRMKTIQGMIAQYFIMRNVENIHFISSVNKLKNLQTQEDKDKDPTSYSERKKMGIKKTIELLTNTDSSLLTFFNKHSKKDDLADCYLQGLYFLKK